MSANLDSLKVMVIDDSKTIRRTAETLLTKAGCQVVTATDGFDALGGPAEGNGLRRQLRDGREYIVLRDPRANSCDTSGVGHKKQKKTNERKVEIKIYSSCIKSIFNSSVAF